MNNDTELALGIDVLGTLMSADIQRRGLRKSAADKNTTSVEAAAEYAGKHGMEALKEKSPEHYKRVKDALDRGEDSPVISGAARVGEVAAGYMGGSLLGNIIRRGRIALDNSIAPGEDFNVTVMESQKDSKGNPLYRDKLDAQGKVVRSTTQVQARDKYGNPKLDKKGNPVMEYPVERELVPAKAVNKTIHVTKPATIKEKLWDKIKAVGPAFGLGKRDIPAIVQEDWDKLPPEVRRSVAEEILKGKRELRLTRGQLSDILPKDLHGLSMKDLGTTEGRKIAEQALGLGPGALSDIKDVDRYRKIHGGFRPKTDIFSGWLGEAKSLLPTKTGWGTPSGVAGKLRVGGRRLLGASRFLGPLGMLAGLGAWGIESYKDKKYRDAYKKGAKR